MNLELMAYHDKVVLERSTDYPSDYFSSENPNHIILKIASIGFAQTKDLQLTDPLEVGQHILIDIAACIPISSTNGIYYTRKAQIIGIIKDKTPKNQRK